MTNWMVLFLAAGLAAQAAGFLLQADLLPAFGEQIWDTSFLLTETSIVGKMHTLIGYTARRAGIQLLVYVATRATILVIVWLGSTATQLPGRRPARWRGLGQVRW